MKDYRLYWIWLACRAGQGSKLAVKLINMFGNAVNVYSASVDDIEKSEDHGFSTREIGQIRKILSDKSLDEAETILEDATKLGQRVLVPTDEDFPKSLLTLRDAPMVLYVAGTLPKMNRELSISVVSTRTMSDSGRRNSYAIGYGLAAGGAVVVSGMALGGDSMAQCGAVSAGGKTVAVLGCGVDVVYPKDHRNLYNTILKHGAIISEYPPRTRPCGFHFPIRNRIISGLSAGTVVVEADMKSGALITAKHAIYQGRHVFAVPGDVASPNSEGTNNLIKNGAFVATSAEDVLAEYEFLYPHSISMKAYFRAMRGLEVDASSEEAMARLRVSARGGKNYYGNGAYGGKNAWLGKGLSSVKTRVKSGDKRNASADVPMGEFAEPVKTEKSVGKYAEKKAPQKLTVPEILPTTEAEKTTSQSRIEFDLLDEINIKVYNLMKPDVPMIPDELVTDTISISEVLSSLSMLELAGAVESGAGGYFLRRSADDVTLDLDE